MDVKEDAEFDVEAEEDNVDDDFFGDPTRYMFYRYFVALYDAWMLRVASLSSRGVCLWQDLPLEFAMKTNEWQLQCQIYDINVSRFTLMTTVNNN